MPGGAPDAFVLDLAVKDNAKDDQGGIKDRVAGVGEAVMVTIDFKAGLQGVGLGCASPGCQAWSVELKGLGADQKGKGFTVASTSTPEPSTIILLASGLAGLAGVGALRNRRENKRSE